jgi:RNA polymerase sigma-70 factor (ECF subfamily)
MKNKSVPITEMLKARSHGDISALENLVPLVESELKRIAYNFRRGENPNHTLQTSALVNEAYLKLINQRNVNWQNRRQFFALSAQIMRRVLLNYARDRSVEKRGGGALHLHFEEVDLISPEKSL